MGDKGGGSGTGTYDYYGTIAMVLRAGPVDQINTLLMDGKAIWTGPIARTDPGVGNPYTLSIANTKLFHQGGYVKMYWGDDDQTVASAVLPNHPPYRGFAYMVFHNFLFGRERTTAPNLEVVCEAIPRPPGSIIAATGLDGTTGCANPWAIAAELLTNVHGCGIAASRLDAASWQAAHDYWALTTDRRLMSYCAPLLTSQSQAQSLVNDLLGLCDGGLRLKADGTIEAFYYPTALGDYTTLTANDLESPASYDAGTWDNVPTGVVVKFRDGARFEKESSVKVDSATALLQAVEPRRESIDLPFIIRELQARKIGAEWVKRKCQPQGAGTITVRAERAVNPGGTALRIGDRFWLDVDPEPGGDGLLQLCRVKERSFKATGPVTIRFEAEATENVVPYVAGWTPETIEEATVPEIPYAQVVPAPMSLSGNEPAIAVLAARGDDNTVGADVLFDVDAGAGTFTTLGTQNGFAVRCKVSADYAGDATGAIRIELLDTRDERLALAQPGASGAQNNELLLCVYRMDGSYIDEDAAGVPLLEWFSIDSSAAVSGNVYDFTVLRSRLGSVALAWVTNDLAWIIPKKSLVPYVHQNFAGYVAGATNLVFRLSPFSKEAEFDGVPDNLAFRFPGVWRNTPIATWTTPATTPYLLAADGNITPAGTITDADANLVKLTLYSKRDDTGVQTTIFDLVFAPTGSITLASCFTAAGVATPLNFAGRVADDTYYTLTLRAQDSEGNLYESQRVLVRGATGGGGGMLPPTFTPEPPGDFVANGTVRMDVASPADRIHYAIQSWYYRTNSAPGSYSTHVGLYYSISRTSSFRLWCRSSNGSATSGWVYGDFTVEKYSNL